MSYKATEQSCTLTEAERLTEAQTLLDIIAGCQESLNAKEQTFVEQMDNATYCSIKQLFWLRDIKDKYL